MTTLFSHAARRPHRRHRAFLILAAVVIAATTAYGLVLNGGWPA